MPAKHALSSANGRPPFGFGVRAGSSGRTRSHIRSNNVCSRRRLGMSRRYYLSPGAFIAAKGQPFDGPPSLLRNRKIGVQKDSTHADWLDKSFRRSAQIKRYATVAEALKGLARVKHILRTLTEQWSILATLTPSEYAEFRGVLGSSSGFQSHQYRAIEFILGNKHPRMLAVFEADPAAHAELTRLLEEPTIYDAFLRLAARRGLPVPASVLERDVREAWVEVPELVPVLGAIYEDREADWALYEACEDLVDLEDAFQFWRFRHMRTVQRTIGFKTGTGGSSGVSFLRRALELQFFPELLSLRTQIGE